MRPLCIDLLFGGEQQRSEEYFLKASGWILTRLVAHKLHRHRLIGHETHFTEHRRMTPNSQDAGASDMEAQPCQRLP
jgi:hypothetical protein